VNPNLLKELEEFFINYNRANGREFRLLDARGPKKAVALIKDGIRRAKSKKNH
jgi:hypothetical protein